MFLFANQYELETLLDSQTVNKKAVECILEYTATRTGTFTTGNHNSATMQYWEYLYLVTKCVRTTVSSNRTSPNTPKT